MAQKLAEIYPPYQLDLAQEEIVNSIVNEINECADRLSHLTGPEWMMMANYRSGLLKALLLAQGIEVVEEEPESMIVIDPREDNTRGY